MNNTQTTVSLTSIRRLIQNQDNDRLLESVLHRHFDPIPAKAMLRHRLPLNRWKCGQIDGAAFHADLSEALQNKIRVDRAPEHLRPALRLLQRYHFRLLPAECGETTTHENRDAGLHGRLDLVGYAGNAKAAIEVKTVHDIPYDYPHLEHSIQASASFLLAWGHRPHGQRDFCRVLYVDSAAPHRAFLLRVSMANRFADVASDLAQEILHGRN